MGFFIPKNPKVEHNFNKMVVHVRETGPPPVQTSLEDLRAQHPFQLIGQVQDVNYNLYLHKHWGSW